MSNLENVISDEAVEAAAREYYEASTGKEWAMLDNFQRPVVLSWMRAALEAAAPHMTAGAYDEGFTACAHEHTKQRNDPTHPITRTNPYRSQA